MDYTAELEAARTLARSAGEAILAIYEGPVPVTLKADESPLTQADLVAHTIIVEGLSARFPQDTIISEEGITQRNASRTWIVDPLDGTKEFITKNGEFTVNIALCIDNKPVVAVIYAPVLDTLYYAHKDHGAYLYTKKTTTKLCVSSLTALAELTLVKSRSHPNAALDSFITTQGITHITTIGSSLKGCLVASAKADLYPRFNPMHEWDVCAMHLIVEEAGGRMTTLDGQQITYNSPNHTLPHGFLVTNGHCHPRILEVIA